MRRLWWWWRRLRWWRWRLWQPRRRLWAVLKLIHQDGYRDVNTLMSFLRRRFSVKNRSAFAGGIRYQVTANECTSSLSHMNVESIACRSIARGSWRTDMRATELR